MRTFTLVRLIGAALALSTATAALAAEMVPWRQHRAPWSFLFGNDFDNHQQTRLTRQGDLKGFFYIRYTGTVTQDGLRVATHADCNMAPDCTVGWTLDGRPASATLVLHAMHDHPVFLIPRADIAQPGAYSHFHWTGMSMPMPYMASAGYLLELTVVSRFCFIHHGAEAATSAVNCRDNGGVAIERGTDIATHLNLITIDPVTGM
ncbi:MAG: hypothetical protein OEU93_07935 [Rubrivivax sp.]|nr:hypothetical protein [Rubrivivax sp.]